ncbi:MAG TPA: hypothetical protein GYA08_15360 [Chloroflexi bacterium]|nr:hypothetical protein [Chloroflexota bacterium]
MTTPRRCERRLRTMAMACSCGSQPQVPVVKWCLPGNNATPLRAASTHGGDGV